MPVASDPLLLLHGFLGAPQSFAPLGLEPSRVFAPVLLGHSGSDLVPGLPPKAVERVARPALELPSSPTPDWGLCHGGFDREVERLATWARERGFTGGTLCGYSLGARLALRLLRRHPTLFTRALLVSVHPGLDTADERRERLRADLERCRVLADQGLAAFVTRWEAEPLFESQASLPEEVRAAQRRLRLAHRAEGVIQSLLHCGLASMPGSADPPPSGVEVAVFAGQRDEKFVRLAQSLDWPSARVEIVPGAGHNLLLERPDLVRAWLA